MKNILTALLLLSSACFCDILSTDGKIRFDTQMDGQAEMTLNSTGLGISVLPSSNLHVGGNAIISDQLFVGGSSGSSNLNVNGTIGFGVQTISADVTLGDSSVVLVDSSSDNITLILPYAGNVIGRVYSIKKTSTSNSVWISGGGNLIEDTNPIELPESNDLASVKLISNGNQWYILEEKDTSITVTSENLIAWWKLDEQSGVTSLDSSSSGDDNSGTLINNSFSSNSQTGTLNSALYFHGDDDVGADGNGDGNGGYISVPDSSSLDISSAITMSLWFYVDEFDLTFPTMISKGAQNYRFYFSEASQKLNVRFVYDGAASINVTTSTVFSTMTWYHVAFTYDGTTRIVYVNGQQEITSVAVDSITTNNDSLIIGNFSAGGSRSFKGRLDDLRIYNKALSSQEIQAIYNQGQ
jgi:hypothetical protein